MLPSKPGAAGNRHAGIFYSHFPTRNRRCGPGSRIGVIGLLERPAPSVNPGQFDWASYDRKQRILASIRVNHPFDIQPLSTGPAPLFPGLRNGARQWLALGFAANRQVDRALLEALMFGDRDPQLRQVQRDFQKTGASHLLASNGLRIAVLASLIFMICRVFGARPRVAALLVLTGIVAWGCLITGTPQALRPVIVAGAVGLGLCQVRQTDSMQLLAIAALAILLIHPLDLYSAGFQFSFVTVFFMLLLIGPAHDFMKNFDNPDEVVLQRLGRLSRLQILRRRAVYHGVQVIIVASVAWIASLPLVAYHFEQFTPWAMLIGLVLAPVVLMAVLLGFVKLALTLLLPTHAAFFASMAALPVATLRHAMAFFAHLPGADIPVASPPVWLILFYYAMICLPLLPASGRMIRWSIRCSPVAACAMLLLMPYLMGFARLGILGGTLRVTLLSVGAGQCAVAELPGNGTIALDAGSSTLTDPFHTCLNPFLHHEARGFIDTIFLSHGDFDHISAAADAWNEGIAGQVITTPYFRRHAAGSVPCQYLLDLLDHGHHPPAEVTAGQTFDFGNDARATVLWPPKTCQMNSNNAGMVLRLTYGGRSILFPADIQDPAMRELLKSPDKLKSDVLVAAHHGSSETLTAAFVRAVDPSVIISSDAGRLTKKQRDFEDLIELRPLYRTSRCGAIEVDVERGGKVTVKPFLAGKQREMVIEAVTK